MMSSIAHRKLDPNNKDVTPILAGILAYQSGVVYANKSNTNCSSILPKFASRSKANFGFLASDLRIGTQLIEKLLCFSF